MQVKESLEECFDYFEKNREEFATTHHGQYVVISGGKPVSFHPTFVAGVLKARKKFKPGCFIVAECVFKHEEVPAVFHSRVGV